ncbi:hypothetical protein B0H16DRAFT_1723303 [Mycena metata]|uniref:Uncharacterized protein n=1 Tax=Mycena metata TaxID=1033252 RepID=A0AAD7NBW3_9AGAR|nr:hypothetical protein B0H16DRAFT_1723303 [Mycena metata]
MSADNTFRISEWIGKGEKWASAPSMLRKIAAAVFAVPQELELVLLPSPSLSIAKMLDFTLPLEHPDSKADPDTVTKAWELCRVGEWNLSQASLTSPAALAALRELCTTNPTLYDALNQTSTSTVIVGGEIEEPAFPTNVYDDCDVPLDVVADAVASGGSDIAANFTVGEDGGVARSRNAEASDAEDEESDLEVDSEPVALGRGQRKKFVARRYQGPAWEEHKLFPAMFLHIFFVKTS